MGSEVVFEILSSFDIQKEYSTSLKNLSEAKGEKRNKLLKKVTLKSIQIIVAIMVILFSILLGFGFL